jgi:CheY-like chemotaxis protein
MQSGKALLSIINDILDLSRIEAGKTNLFMEDFNIRVLMNEVGKLMGIISDKKGLAYKTMIDVDISERLIGDPDRLKQILFNLIGNAIKFTEQGSVEIAVKKGKTFEDQVQLLFSVKDTGIGIPEETIGQLFTYFVQADDSIIKKYGGTGLGLAISNQLIKLMDGEISVQSKLGEGSNFLFSAIFKKVNDDKKIVVHSLKDTPETLGSGASALLVENDYISGIILEKLCKKKGIHLKIAISGQKALEMLKHENFDIIFMDIQLPEMSGYEVAGHIREMEKTLDKHTPIIATTAFALVGDNQKCMDSGMDEYLAKPIDAEKLYSILQKYL